VNVILALKIAGIIASLLLAVAALLSRQIVTRSGFVISMVATILLVLCVGALLVLQGQSVRVEPFLLLGWMVVFVFYFFGTRYAQGFGLFHNGAPQGAQTEAVRHPRLERLLLVARHLLIWPMVALVAIVLAKGLSGQGWVTRITLN
jgi:hypothetical protein